MEKNVAVEGIKYNKMMDALTATLTKQHSIINANVSNLMKEIPTQKDANRSVSTSR